MISYITNCLFKTGKLKKSLDYAEILKKSMNEYKGFLRDKYIFYYYNALVINYSKLDKKKALDVLKEVKSNSIIKQLPTYTVFIYLNTALIHFDLGNYREANKNLTRLLLQDDFVDLGRSFQLKIEIASLIIRYMIKDFDACEFKIEEINKKHSEILDSEGLARDKELITIISKLLYCNNINLDKEVKERIKSLSRVITDEQSDDTDVINYNVWLKSLL
jgi:tetratricopeptide (TPR) repeat protein